ncbi:hypothetical protein BCR33DRAFT_583578 [Rhizoclosmatium globosum]|uniref:PAP-associated domain-containing protein n=1 Tax=Rhizoclosmatium globosum TaxID=329046 RepID=A0A1Y2CR42_9FUNG|nr:hypothetical protein BCR33DRAFT_583578 [Rhizoclosmatium globosum]|eukprot:ORY49482.1 hypothetical protein BCR33DRAFT_583578 [Rhizoclosmatium globosum]
MRSSNHTSSIEFVRKARVPVLKMVDRVTNMNIDVCYNVLGGYQAVECVKLWVEKVPGLRELVLLVKLFLSTKDLSEVFSGGLGGYSIVSLCLAFLQLRNPITGEIEMSTSLPSKKRPHSSSSSFSSTSSTITPGQTFLQFCRFFGTQFDYHTLGIKFTPTTPIPQAHFFNKLSSPHYQPSKPYLLTLLNPLDPSTDLTKGSSKIQSVSFAFRSAIPVLERGLTASFASKKPRIVTPTRYWERDFERGDDLPTLQPVLSDPEPIQLTQATSIFSELVFISRRMVKARDLGTGVSVSLFGKDGDRGTATEVDDNEPHSSHVRFEDEDDAERDSFMIGGIMMQDSGDESDSADEEDAEFTAVLDDVEEEVELTVETVEPEKAPTLPDDSDGYIAFDFDASDSVDQYGFTIDRTPVIPLPDSLSDQTPSTTSHEPIQSQQLVRTLPPQLPSPPPQKRPPSRKSFNYRALEEKHKAKLKASKKHDKADHTRLQKEIDSSSSSKHPSPHLSKNKLRKQNAKQRSLDLSLPVSQFDEFDKFDRGGGIQKRRGKRERASSKAQTRESDWKKWERELQDDFIGFRFGGKGRSNHEGNSGKGERRKRRQ